jgi:predicted kinase
VAAADPSEANAEILAHQIATAQPLATDERIHTAALDTEVQDLDAMVSAIEDAIARRKGPD